MSWLSRSFQPCDQSVGAPWVCECGKIQSSEFNQSEERAVRIFELAVTHPLLESFYVVLTGELVILVKIQELGYSCLENLLIHMCLKPAINLSVRVRGVACWLIQRVLQVHQGALPWLPSCHTRREPTRLMMEGLHRLSSDLERRPHLHQGH